MRFGSTLYRQIIGIPMCTNCAPFVADLVLFCYERDFMSLFRAIIKQMLWKRLTLPQYNLDALLNINNPYFAQMVSLIYPTELQLNIANPSDTEAPFLDLDMSITSGIVSTIYDKRDDFNFEIVSFPFFAGGAPSLSSYGRWYTVHFTTYSFCKSMFSLSQDVCP